MCANTCDVQVRELVGLKVGKGDAIVNSLADDVEWTCVDLVHKINYYVLSQKSGVCERIDMPETLPFEVVMALNDTTKAKKKVEHWKRSIPKVDQAR